MLRTRHFLASLLFALYSLPYLSQADDKLSDLLASKQDAVFNLVIERNMTCADNSTIGRILVNDKEVGRSLELPWKNNETAISRIPQGTYPAWIRRDGKKGWRIQLEGVPDRKLVQLHVGNYPRQTQGCILVGKDVSHNGSVCMVTQSKAALSDIAGEMSSQAAALGGNQSKLIAITVTVR